MAWYNVDCIQFNINQDNPVGLGVTEPDGKWVSYYGTSSIVNGYGVINIFAQNNFRDSCGNSVLEHELQRFHQQRFDYWFCNGK